ncbi:MAG: hypothetical protein H0T73_09165 [Ardenticatenales bacterium]|nr:hypothetical protein [Ardenticatenales bacterium]
MEDWEACHASPHPHVASLRVPSPDIGRGAAAGRGEGHHAEPPFNHKFHQNQALSGKPGVRRANASRAPALAMHHAGERCPRDAPGSARPTSRAERGDSAGAPDAGGAALRRDAPGDGRLARAGGCPSPSWLPPEILLDAVRLALPPTLPAGRYTLAVGWYQSDTLQRLPTGTGDLVPLPLTVQVEP